MVKHPSKPTTYQESRKKKATGKKKRKIRRIYREKGKYEHEGKEKKLFVW